MKKKSSSSDAFSEFLSLFKSSRHVDAFKSHAYALVFYKYLSDNFEDYVSEFLIDKNFTMSEAFSDNEIKVYLKKSALEDLGYFIDFEYLYSHILIDDNGNHDFKVRKLDDALNSIASSSKGYESESVFLHVFDNVDWFNPQMSKIVKDKRSFIIDLIKHIALFDDEYPLSYYFEKLIYFFDENEKSKEDNLTVKEISFLISKIATVDRSEAESIYDPFLGTAMNLIDIAKEIPVASVYGQELDLEKYNLALMNLIIHDFSYKEIDIVFGDTITEPKHLSKKFDIIVSEPPRGLKNKLDPADLKGTERFRGYKLPDNLSRSEFLLLVHMIYHLKDDGTVVSVIPKGALSRNVDELIKEELIGHNNYLDAVINLPANLLPNTKNEISLLVFKKNRVDRNVLFIDASKEFESQRKQNILTDENINKIISVYEKREEIDKFSYLANLDEIRDNEFNLSISRYIDTFEGEFVNLDEVISKKQELNKDLDDVVDRINHLSKELGLDI